MTEAMPFLQKAILLSYDPRPFGGVHFYIEKTTGSDGGFLYIKMQMKPPPYGHPFDCRPRR